MHKQYGISIKLVGLGRRLKNFKTFVLSSDGRLLEMTRSKGNEYCFFPYPPNNKICKTFIYLFSDWHISIQYSIPFERKFNGLRTL